MVSTGRNEERGTETARLITEAGGEAIFLPHDVTSTDDWVRVIDKTLGSFGRLDTLINNAGDAVLKPITDLKPNDLEFLMRLNFEGPFLGMKEAIPCMKEGGAIINITVLTAMVGNANSTAYSIAKGSLAHLTRAVARDCVHKDNGVRVNAIVPGVLFEGGVVSPGATRVHGGPRRRAALSGKDHRQDPARDGLASPRTRRPRRCSSHPTMPSHVTGMEYVVDGGRMAGGN